MTDESWPDEWEPANVVERDMAAALAGGDGPGYARLLRSVPLLVPDLPPAGSAEAAMLAGLLPPGPPYIPVFTSWESLVWAFGDLAAGCEELGFAALLQRWPGPRFQLAVDPGTPIAVFLPPRAVADLATGRQPLVAYAAVREVVAEEATDQIRRLCLRELAGDENVDDVATLRDDEPANVLEAALRAAVTRADGNAYLDALVSGDVVLPTAAPVADPDRILDEDFPWRVVGGDQAKVIPVFTSTAMFARTCRGHPPWLATGLLPVLTVWPGAEFLLYVNPGSVLEMLLPGEAVLELLGMAPDVDDGGPGPG